MNMPATTYEFFRIQNFFQLRRFVQHNMSKPPSRNEASQPMGPIVTRGSRGIKKTKRPDPLNIAEPLVRPQESITTKKNRSEAMKAYWSKRKTDAQGAQDNAGDSNEMSIEMRQVATTSNLRGSGSKPTRTLSVSGPNSSELEPRAILQVSQEKDFDLTDLSIPARASLTKGQKRKADLSLRSHIKANSGTNIISHPCVLSHCSL